MILFLAGLLSGVVLGAVGTCLLDPSPEQDGSPPLY